MNYYTGVGARETPLEILDIMREAATYLESEGWHLRSGGAAGADSAFAQGIYEQKNKTIYLPWRGFHSNYGKECIALEDMDPALVQEAKDFTASLHPEWYNCQLASQLFHTRNVFAVMGNDGTNISKFLMCWTPNGSTVGGTGQAIRIAEKLGVPVFNLGGDTMKVQQEILDFIQQFKVVA